MTFSPADPFAPMDSDDIEAEQERIYREWLAKKVDVTQERVADMGDYIQRAEAMRGLIVKQARELLSNSSVQMPPEVRAGLEELVRGEAAVKSEAA